MTKANRILVPRLGTREPVVVQLQKSIVRSWQWGDAFRSSSMRTIVRSGGTFTMGFRRRTRCVTRAAGLRMP